MGIKLPLHHEPSIGIGEKAVVVVDLGLYLQVKIAEIGTIG